MLQHESYGTSLVALFKSIYRNRNVIYEMSKRDVIGRYKGSAMGLMWSFITPIFMLTVYTVVFSEVFNARWGTSSGSDSKAQFAIILYVGLLVHSIFGEVLSRSPTLIISNVNYVKKIVFPLETFPVITLFSVMFHTAISFVVLLVAFFAFNGYLNLTILFVPIVFTPVIVLTLALSYIFSSLGVYIRDLNQFTTLIVTVILFLSPVFYSLSSVPAKYQTIILLNPLTFIIEQARDVIVWGKLPNFVGLGIYLVLSLLALWASYYWFQKTRKGFADVL